MQNRHWIKCVQNNLLNGRIFKLTTLTAFYVSVQKRKQYNPAVKLHEINICNSVESRTCVCSDAYKRLAWLLQKRRHDIVSQRAFNRWRHTRRSGTSADGTTSRLGGAEGRLVAWISALTATAIRICRHRKSACATRTIQPDGIFSFTVNYVWSHEWTYTWFPPTASLRICVSLRISFGFCIWPMQILGTISYWLTAAVVGLLPSIPDCAHHTCFSVRPTAFAESGLANIFSDSRRLLVFFVAFLFLFIVFRFIRTVKRTLCKLIIVNRSWIVSKHAERSRV